MNKDEISLALKLAAPCLVSSNYIPVLSHYCFTKSHVYAYDDVSAILVGLETGLNCAVRGETLAKQVELCDEQLRLKRDGDKVLLSSGSTKLNLPIIEAKDFAYQEPEDEEWSAELELSKDLLTGMGLCVASVSKDPLLHKEWTAVTLRVGPSGSAMYAFDGVGLIRYSAEAVTAKRDRVYMIPESICRQIGDLAAALLQKEKDQATLQFGKNYLRAHFAAADVPDVRLVGKLLHEKAPDHEHMIEGLKMSAKSFPIPKGFHRAVERVAEMVRGDLEPRCTVAVDGTQMIVRGEGGLGSAETVLEISKLAKKATAVVQPDRLLRYEDRLKSMAVETGSIVMRGPGVAYYSATIQEDSNAIQSNDDDDE